MNLGPMEKAAQAYIDVDLKHTSIGPRFILGSIHSTIGHGQEFWDAMPIDFTRGWGVRWRRL